MSTSEVNREVMTDFVELFHRQGRVREAFEKHADPAYRQHSPGFPDGREATIVALEEFFAGMQPGFPQMDVRHLVIDGDIAVVHLHGRASEDDRGSVGTDIFRLENGKIVEHWDVVQPVPDESRNPHTMY